jgi:DNA-binding NtrC family response regulator
MDTSIQDLQSGDLRLLVVEDSESDAKLAIWGLREAGFNCTYRCVENEADMRTALRAELPDLILSDFSLPKFDGMSALAVAIAEAPKVPFIFLTGMVGEELAIEALKCGAIDYVLKSNPVRLAPAVKRALQGCKAA